MVDQHFPQLTEIFGPFEVGERAMWRGRAGVAEYAFDQVASAPRWTLPETTDVLVTDRRVIYAYASDHGEPKITSGELRWLWPQHLRVQPGIRTPDRGSAATQIQLVCGSADGGYPALVFAGGDLATVQDADKMANVLRQAIVRFRVENADRLGLSTPQARMLSRLLIGPEFNNFQGGTGQTVSLLGALLVSRPAAVQAAPVAPVPPPAAPGEHTRVLSRRPGVAADAARAWAAARAEAAAQQAQPVLAYRAAELAARVAELVSESESESGLWESPATSFEVPTVNLTDRAEAVRRATARSTRNSAGRWADRGAGVTTHRNG